MQISEQDEVKLWQDTVVERQKLCDYWAERASTLENLVREAADFIRYSTMFTGYRQQAVDLLVKLDAALLSLPSVRPAPSEDRCGNCDHMTCLHDKHGCAVIIQVEGSVRRACGCTWNQDQASSAPSVREEPLTHKEDCMWNRGWNACDCGVAAQTAKEGKR